MELSAPVADDETTRLVLQMQLDDFYELSERRRGKQKEHTPPDDFWIAVDLYHAELESAKRTLSDGKMSLSIAIAVRDDGNLISEWTGQEAQATEDRKLAVRLGTTGKTDKDHHDGSQPTDKGGSATDHDDELLDKLAALYVFGPDEQGTETDAGEAPAQPESSSWAASRRTPQKKKQQQRQCAICLDQFPPHEVARAPCAEHEYCGRCLADLFTRSLTDESLFPPRCCGQPISIASGGVRIFLAPELVDAFLARTLEMETPDRTYCHRPGCSTFLPPRAFVMGGDVGACPRCGARTCAVCKQEAPHPGGDCPEDRGLQEVLRVAAENEWQRCYSCHSVVELQSGCHHITCRCGAQFCYVCAAVWKSCDCPQWHEDRLLDRAVAVVDRDIGLRVVQPAQRAELVQAARQDLVANHECRHLSWRRITGRHRCEECHDVLPLYLNVCQRCHIMVCQRCRLNRL